MDYSKSLTEAQKNAIWDLCRKHGLMTLEQGTNSFDEALFKFSSEVALVSGIGKLAWNLLEAIDNERSGYIGVSDWSEINKADKALRAALGDD